MFSFFRRYQRIIFLGTTAIIILSFSFFGTYSSMVNSKVEDPVLFTSLKGHKVTKSECMSYVDFLSIGTTGNAEHRLNLFNDGFLEKDILSTCVGEAIFEKWKEKGIAQYLAQKKVQEASYHLYQHPKAPFLSTEYVWNYFAPQMKDSFALYQQNNGRDANSLFKAKASLFVAEKQCPGAFVKQLLLYQEKQASWLEPDASLAGRDFSLFGYQSANDWFGEEFMQHVVETVVDGAEVAVKEGFSVSDAEVLSSLYTNVKTAASRYSDLADRPLDEILQVSLRSLGMDLITVKKVWKTLLLYRYAYTNLYDHLAVSSFPFRKILAQQSRSRTLNTYSLQPALRVHSTEDLAELYLWKQAVLPKSDDISFFTEGYRSPEAIMSSFHEFVQERFSVSYRMVGPEQLEPLIKLKDLWKWQADEKNFALLAEKFPRLLEEKVVDAESRARAIESLPASLQHELNQYSKKLFLQGHPEWIEQQMKHQASTTKVLFLRPRGESGELEGISNMVALADLLRKSPVSALDDHLKAYSQDGVHFYEFVVQDKSTQFEVVPLIQLREDGTLSRVLAKMLETQYPVLRKISPKQFLKENGEWKPFNEVRLEVLDVYLAPLYSRLDKMRPEMEKQYPYLCQWTNTQEARFALFTLPLVLSNIKTMEMKGDVVSNPVTYEQILTGSKKTIDLAADTLFDFVTSTEKVLADQLEKMPQLSPLFANTDALSSMVLYQPKVGTSYVVVAEKGEEPYDLELRSTLYSLDAFISNSARRQKIEILLQKIPAGISL